MDWHTHSGAEYGGGPIPLIITCLIPFVLTGFYIIKDFLTRRKTLTPKKGVVDV